MTRVRVLKFGGTSVAGAAGLRRVTALIEQEVNKRTGIPVVVVSAMKGVTDLLFQLAHHAQQGGSFRHGLARLQQDHLLAAEQSLHASLTRPSLLTELASAFVGLERDLGAASGAGEWGMASVAAWGERLSVLLLTAVLQSAGVAAAAVHEEVIVTESPPHFRASTGATPCLSATQHLVRSRLEPLLSQGIVPVVPGFIARTQEGNQTLLGRGGSDWTATLVAACLEGCEEVHIFTDVSGVLTTDPRVVGWAQPLPRLSYEEAGLLARFGAKVLHPQTLSPLIERRIPVHIRNSFDPGAPGTVIGPYPSLGEGLGALALRRSLGMVTVRTEPHQDMMCLGTVHGILENTGIAPVFLWTSDGHQISFVAEEELASRSQELLRAALGEKVHIACRRGLAACTYIGGNLLGDLIRPGCALTTLAAEGIPVEAVSLQERSLTLLVQEEAAERALRELYAALIPTRSAVLV